MKSAWIYVSRPLLGIAVVAGFPVWFPILVLGAIGQASIDWWND